MVARRDTYKGKILPYLACTDFGRPGARLVYAYRREIAAAREVIRTLTSGSYRPGTIGTWWIEDRAGIIIEGPYSSTDRPPSPKLGIR